MMTENGGVFVCKTRHLVLAGAGSGHNRVCINELELIVVQILNKINTEMGIDILLKINSRSNISFIYFNMFQC